MSSLQGIVSLICVLVAVGIHADPFIAQLDKKDPKAASLLRWNGTGCVDKYGFDVLNTDVMGECDSFKIPGSLSTSFLSIYNCWILSYYHCPKNAQHRPVSTPSTKTKPLIARTIIRETRSVKGTRED